VLKGPPIAVGFAVVYVDLIASTVKRRRSRQFWVYMPSGLAVRLTWVAKLDAWTASKQRRKAT
jgi:hypothetical protein